MTTEKQYNEKIKQLEKDRDYYIKQYQDEPGWEAVVFMFILGALIMFLILLFIGYFDSPMAQLKIDKNLLAKDYVLSYYPQYSNCSIEYTDCLKTPQICSKGVEIYCDQPTNKDGMEFYDPKMPTKEIVFKNITIEKIFKDKIESCLKW